MGNQTHVGRTGVDECESKLIHCQVNPRLLIEESIPLKLGARKTKVQDTCGKLADLGNSGVYGEMTMIYFADKNMKDFQQETKSKS